MYKKQIIDVKSQNFAFRIAPKNNDPETMKFANGLTLSRLTTDPIVNFNIHGISPV